MFTAIHVAIALFGLVAATCAWLRPGGFIIPAAWSLTAATVVSGIVLVVLQPSSLGHACLAGLAYLGASCTMTARGSLRLAQATATVR